MSPRKRITKNKGLPENLYTNTSKGITYYRYRSPDKTYHPLGKSRADAIVAARKLNAHFDSSVPEVSIVDKILSKSEANITELVKRFREEFVSECTNAESTRELEEYRLNKIEKDLGSTLVSSVTTKLVADYLDNNFKGDSYKKHRGTLIQLFRFAINKGLAQSNPVESTFTKKGTNKKRQRMTLAQYKALHAAGPEWMKVAMEISLLTLQGRHEVVNMKLEDLRDDYLYVVRQKTRKNDWAYLRIKVSDDIKAIFERAESSPVNSPYLVHHEPSRRVKAKGRDHWSQFTPNRFNELFRELRDSLPIFANIPKDERPTFHEIRALGSYLYKKAGYKRPDVKVLMAHSDEKMTELYQSGHEIEWNEAIAELPMKTALETTV